MNIPNRKEIGKSAEEKAKLYLEKQGLHFLIQNYSCFSGEIDLIMRDKEDIVFVEVRSKCRTDYGLACESINKSKQRKIIKAATHFLQKKDWLYRVNSRFDVVTIELTTGKWQMEWIKNAFWIEN